MRETTRHDGPSYRRAVIVCGVLYAIMAAGIVAGMFTVRARVLASRGSVEVMEQWGQWVDAASGHEGDGGPVRRRVPQSAEPPWMVLLADHFPACLAGLLLMSTGLFVTTAFFAVGVLRSPGRTPSSREDDS